MNGIKALPRKMLAYLPTPVERMPVLQNALGGPELWVKRDDQTGLAFGGNKTRKLEYLLADAEAAGAQTLITGGALQSNHCRQTAAAAARAGLDCILVLNGEPEQIPSGNLFLDNLFGAEFVFTTRPERDAAMQQAFQDARAAGRKPYLIPYGGSNFIGASAYALAVREMLEQGLDPDWIVVASSSGGTQAGMVAGKTLFGFKGKVLGISIDEPQAALQEKVAELAGGTAELLGSPQRFDPAEVLVNVDYLGAGYGVMGAPEQEAIRFFAGTEGLLVDPVYTGRAGAGLIDLVRKGFFKKEETVLFWHTGGTPALLAERYRVPLAQAAKS